MFLAEIDHVKHHLRHLFNEFLLCFEVLFSTPKLPLVFRRCFSWRVHLTRIMPVLKIHLTSSELLHQNKVLIRLIRTCNLSFVVGMLESDLKCLSQVVSKSRIVEAVGDVGWTDLFGG
jgi:hypothetical protein